MNFLDTFRNLSPKNKIFNISIVIMRLLAPLTIFLDPIACIVICTFLDAIDWSIYLTHGINVEEKHYDEIYQEVDKILDFYYYLSLLIYILGNFENNLKLLFSLLLLYRLLGLVVFSFVKNRNVFLLFPNVFENFAIGMILAERLDIKDKTLLIFVIALIIKLLQEIFVHGPLKAVNHWLAVECVRVMTWPARSLKKHS